MQRKVEEEVSEECASCEVQDCNPYYKASINIYKTFDWYVAGILFYSGPETQINFRASDEDFGDYFYSGSAYVIATYEDGCTEMQTVEWDDTSTAELIEKSLDATDYNLKTLSTNAISSSDVKIYPNPTNGIVNIDIAETDYLISGNLCITDISGKIVELRTLSNNNISIDLSEQSRGTYILSIISDKKVITQKIIKY